jgi:EAL domain-containing protein (putative c-di-GMP-specific phosphodiesterase class I)
MKVVAEGIERPETVRRLGARGVEFGQGYLYGRPSPPAVAESEAVHLALA